jgi:NADPH:quinone reductase-like Zn-dependent oxidoreductase
VLQLADDEMREPAPGEVRIRVRAAGVAWPDVMMRTGLYPGKMPALPFAPGYDVAGVVDRVGPGSAFRVGQPVAAITITGGYAETVWVPEIAVAPVPEGAPEGLDPFQVTCLPLNHITAYQMLHRFARVKAGERILVHGAAGGVGTALLQLAALAGVESYGTASAGKHDAVRRLGATPIDYRNEDFVERIRALTGEGVEAVFDPIGGGHMERSYAALCPGGRLIAYGERSIVGSGVYNAAEAETQEAFLRRQKADPDGKTVQWYECYDHVLGDPGWFQEDMKALLGLLGRQAIQPVIAARLPLEQAARAQAMLEAGAVTGKIVLDCQNGERRR